MRRFSLIYLAWFELQAILWFKIGNVEGIVGGKPAVHDQFKYMVSVQADGEHICGGAIMDEKHIITAAHCFLENGNKFLNKKYTVLGRSINLVLDIVPHVELVVSTIYVAKEFVRMNRNPGIFFYPEIGDIAVLVLEEKLPLGEHLRTLSFPQLVNGNQHKYVHKTAILTGYGSNVDPYRSLMQNYHKTQISNKQGPVLRFKDTTVQHFYSAKNKFPFPINEKMLIAAVNQPELTVPQGACAGDDGSPLVYNGMLIGVLAQYWVDCNETGVGSIYTRVSKYRGCIQQVMNKQYGKNNCMSKYNKISTRTGQITWQMEKTFDVKT